MDSEEDVVKAEYIVYMCEKCKQYTYAKVSQSAKKCPRCHHSMPITERLEYLKTRMHGTIVRGVTAANLQVRVMQNASHAQPAGFTSSVKSVAIHKGTGGFVSQGSEVKSSNDDKYGSEYLQFLRKIKEWQATNSIQSTIGFPMYMLDMILQELNVPDKTATYLKYKLNKHFGFRVINKEYCYLN